MRWFDSGRGHLAWLSGKWPACGEFAHELASADLPFKSAKDRLKEVFTGARLARLARRPAGRPTPWPDSRAAGQVGTHVGFANSSAVVFVDESAEEIATAKADRRGQRRWVAAAGPAIGW